LTKLSVNVNKVALLRNAREGGVPDVVAIALAAIEAGAHGITVHPRPDLRHIRPQDVRDIAAAIDVEFNIEGNPFSPPGAGYPGFLALVREVRPAQATLVPDSVDQLTSDHGWAVAASRAHLAPVIDELKTLGCRVSLFMDCGTQELELVRGLGADRIELYTEDYARAHAAGASARDAALAAYAATARQAQSLGLGVNAGHDLNLHNLRDFCASVPDVREVSIGQALVADALMLGLPATVRRYLACLPGNGD
jgi:pyridoxine 5-phosphate synthase